MSDEERLAKIFADAAGHMASGVAIGAASCLGVLLAELVGRGLVDPLRVQVLCDEMIKRLEERDFTPSQLTMAKHVVELFKTSARDIAATSGPPPSNAVQ